MSLQYLQLLLYSLITTTRYNNVFFIERRNEDATQGSILNTYKIVEIDDAILAHLSHRRRN